MIYPNNLHEQFLITKEITNLTNPKNQLNRILNELETSHYRFTLPGFGWERNSFTAKLTAEEKQAADEFAKKLPIKTAAEILKAMEKGFILAKASKASQQTYGSRMRACLEPIESEGWYPGNGELNRRLEDECRPPMRYGRGDWKSFALMEEKGKPTRYRLKKEDISPSLEEKLDFLTAFMADPNNLDRPFGELEESTASGYRQGTLLWLGWMLYYSNASLKPETLTLEDLIPKVTTDSLEGLSLKQQKLVWTNVQRKLEANINHYFQFLQTVQDADSPRTRMLKLTTLLILAKFIYASEVEDEREYHDIPIIRFILKRIDKEQEAVEQWEKDRHYVADQSRKWPDAPPGQTVLEYTQEALIEPLRLECRPRQGTGDFCKGHIIAKSHLFYLMFVEMGLLPPGRQQEPRSYRIALSCPIVRPDTVPANGVYWPLPPDWAREKRLRNGSLADNYLYKVYHYDGQFYEQGVWIREKCRYKTHRFHGKRIGIIDNILFEDGHCLYDYIERYLCGQWYVANFRNGHRYDWWDTKLQGRYGKWLSTGRAELCTEETEVIVREGKSETWVSGYLFLNFKNGLPFTDIQMSALFARNAYRVIGKRTTPHTFRYMWATWAFQMELSDAELESLAHAMGCTVKTLRRMYERCSPMEKNRPINKAMRKLFPWQTQGALEALKGNRSTQIKEFISQLSPEELQNLQKFLGTEPPAA